MRILLVDSDPAALLAHSDQLTALGHEVMWAADPREVLALLAWPEALVVSARASEVESLALARVARLLRDGLRVAVLLADGLDAHAVQIARRSGCTVLAGARVAAALVRFVGLAASHPARAFPLGRPGCV